MWWSLSNSIQFLVRLKFFVIKLSGYSREREAYGGGKGKLTAKKKPRGTWVAQ